MATTDVRPAVDVPKPTECDALERALIDRFQRDFPLSAAPFADVADRLGVAEDDVLEALRRLTSRGIIDRVGPVIAARRAGASTLAAMEVPADRFDEVADLVSAYPEVNHNYEREHRFNLWFVVTGDTETTVLRVLADIESTSGLPVLDLPLQTSYRIDLGFPIAWN
jgi:DNA-binding Lrp family transcriptional regulator